MLLDLVLAISVMNILMAGICIWMNAWVIANIAIIAVTLLHAYFQIRNYKKFTLPTLKYKENAA
jgi:hypothetical protein